jgi:hypothetical protein
MPSSQLMCKNCKWYGPNASILWDTCEEESTDSACLRFPPSVYVISDPGVYDMFPHVNPNNWHHAIVRANGFCGEYKEA